MNMDDLVLLLVVKERFAITNLGLVLEPDFDMPRGTAWKGPTFFAVARTAEGGQAKFRATLSPMHAHVRNPQGRKPWRLTVVLHGAEKEEVPIGCSVWCEAAVLARLMERTTP